MSSPQNPAARHTMRFGWRLLAGLLTLTGVLAFQATAASAADDCHRDHVGCATLVLDDRWRTAWLSSVEHTRSDCPANDVETHWKVRYRANSRNVDIAYVQVWNLSDTRLSPDRAETNFGAIGSFWLKRGTSSLSKYKNSKIHGGTNSRADEVWSPSNIAWGSGQLTMSFRFRQTDGHAFCGIAPTLQLKKR